jgi:hypothetical protein
MRYFGMLYNLKSIGDAQFVFPYSVSSLHSICADAFQVDADMVRSDILYALLHAVPSMFPVLCMRGYAPFFDVSSCSAIKWLIYLVNRRQSSQD